MMIHSFEIMQGMQSMSRTMNVLFQSLLYSGMIFLALPSEAQEEAPDAFHQALFSQNDTDTPPPYNRNDSEVPLQIGIFKSTAIANDQNVPIQGLIGDSFSRDSSWA